VVKGGGVDGKEGVGIGLGLGGENEEVGNKGGLSGREDGEGGGVGLSEATGSGGFTVVVEGLIPWTEGLFC